MRTLGSTSGATTACRVDGHAAELYQREAGLLATYLPHARGSQGVEPWSEQARAREIEVLTEARSLDAEAIGEIEKALSLLE